MSLESWGQVSATAEKKGEDREGPNKTEILPNRWITKLSKRSRNTRPGVC